ncbi:HIG1 domain-containing protein [Sphingopyxis sp. YF1]|jgi:formate hydrogenlyase subunit 3/multisubunit Na+/H+ antiporter MnhD subunit|uniref:HIG1 domain-containing protein n=1 Tax=Sphingopyxis sp. YF1 TaxID=2482763 RepID=UPI001F6121C9|nr:HIG1 domain-containing protein [Sphingopyxis sp. YF1]HZG33645.1 HIG1 domain-containing protein [Sphingopyxis sp.]
MKGMEILLVLGVVVAAGFVLFSLARGLLYFAQGHRAAIDGKVEENQRLQNRMMMARVKWQAITIILLVLIGFVAAGK